MAAQQEMHVSAQEQETDGGRMKRRGILAAAGAIVAGIAAKAVAEPVSANPGDPILLGQAFTGNNQSSLPTGIEYTGSTLPAPNNSIFMVADQAYPLNAGNTVGVIAGAATSAALNGVYGYTQVNNGAGVIGVGGISGPGLNATGVQGISSGGGSAVLGQSGGTGPGVYGGFVIGNSNNVNGVEGHGGGSFSGVAGFGGPSNGNGVIGFGGGTTGTGVRGQSTSGTGVYGSTTTGLYGVYGIAGSHQVSGGVVGVATKAGTIGFAGAAFAPATDAGYFTGNVSVFGSFAVSGSKFAVVKGGTGSTGGCTRWRAPNAGSRTSAPARWRTGRRRSRWTRSSRSMSIRISTMSS